MEAGGAPVLGCVLTQVSLLGTVSLGGHVLRERQGFLTRGV